MVPGPGRSRFRWSLATVAGVISAGLVITALSIVACATDGRPRPAELAPILGTWRGCARSDVAWSSAELPLELTIHADTSVTGRIGDATLRGGRIEHNRTSLGAALGVFSDWVIIGALDGDLVAPARLHRDAVQLPLDEDGALLSGRLDASGNLAPSDAGGGTARRDARDFVAAIDALHHVP